MIEIVVAILIVDHKPMQCDLFQHVSNTADVGHFVRSKSVDPVRDLHGFISPSINQFRAEWHYQRNETLNRTKAWLNLFPR